MTVQHLQMDEVVVAVALRKQEILTDNLRAATV
jgi:hypothetical protein